MNIFSNTKLQQSLKSRDDLTEFIHHDLGYTVNPILFEPDELNFSENTTGRINYWCQISRYAGSKPFYLNLVELKELKFKTCLQIAKSYEKRNIGDFVYLFTYDYCHIAFLALHTSLQRKPSPDKTVWRKELKMYPRLALLNCKQPTFYERNFLSLIQLKHQNTQGDTIYKRILDTLRDIKHPNPLPDWFISQPSQNFTRGKSNTKADSVIEELAKIEDCIVYAMACEKSLILDDAIAELTTLANYLENNCLLPAENLHQMFTASIMLEEAQGLMEERSTTDGVSKMYIAMDIIKHIEDCLSNPRIHLDLESLWDE